MYLVVSSCVTSISPEQEPQFGWLLLWPIMLTNLMIKKIVQLTLPVQRGEA